MGASHFVLAVAVVTSGLGQTTSKEDIETQNAIFKKWWGSELNWKFDELSEKSSVPSFRVPYSGHIWPDNLGGVVSPLQKYDRAFYRGRNVATGYELWDANSGRERGYVEGTVRYGLFGRVISRPVMVNRVPYWHGHCNGWAAAAIRHPEPQTSVVRNGVTFTPADIKGLLAEVYVYSQYESLAGEYGQVSPALLHVLIANWIGKKQYPIAVEAVPGKERWNYPMYAYATTSRKLGDRRVEVKMNIAYSYYSNQEYDRSEHLKRVMLFHYALNLNNEGEIVGGSYYWDSSQIDLLWAPLPVVPGGEEGNARGNPHIDVAEVMQMARESVSDELLKKWDNGAQNQMVGEVPADPPSDNPASDNPADSPSEDPAVVSAESSAASAP